MATKKKTAQTETGEQTLSVAAAASALPQGSPADKPKKNAKKKPAAKTEKKPAATAETAEATKKTASKKKAAPKAEAAEFEAAAAAAAAESKAKPKKTSSKKKAASKAEVIAETEAAATAETAAKPKKTSTKKKAAPKAEAIAEAEAAAALETAAKPKKTTSKKKAAPKAEAAAAVEVAAAPETTAKPKKTTSKKKAAPKAEAAAVEAAAAPEAAAKPKKTSSKKKAAPKAEAAAEAETVADAETAENPKKASTKKKAAPKAEAIGEAEAAAAAETAAKPKKASTKKKAAPKVETAEVKAAEVAISEQTAEETAAATPPAAKTKAEPVKKTPAQLGKKLAKAAAVLLMLALLSFGGVRIYQNWHTPPLLLSAEVISFDAQSGDVTVRLSGQSLQYFGKALWLCLANENQPPAAESELWLAADEAGCAELTLPAGVYYAFAKDARGNVSALPQSSVGDAVLHISVDAPDTVYLPYGGIWQYQPQLLVMGETDTAVSWQSSDESIATVENGVVTAQKTSGTVTVTAKTQNGLKAEMQLLVTDLFKLPNINTYSKPMLRADVFTDEEAALLDEILAQKVALAGYGTRAGAVAAARFLALEFPYRVPYFFENGRMSPHPGRPFCDGEGRYYHEGLYLSENKYDELEVVRFGPATWGELLINWEEKYHFKRGEYYPNGLDCSGFVSWCMINGGNDFGDMGAGYSTDRTGNNMCELGELLPITKELMLSDRVKVGDLIGTDGHIAIIIGITDDYVYIAESLITSVRVMRKPRSRVKASGLYDFVVLMDGVYAAEGNYTEYWE